MRFDLPHLATRLFNAPLAVSALKAAAIAGAVGQRIATGDPAPSPKAEITPRPPVAGVGSSPARVALISVEGTLVHRGLSGLAAESGLTGYDALREDLRGALADPGVDAVLLDVNSPGGEVAGLPELAAEVAAARDTKPVYAFADGDMCSAAYWLSCGAKSVYASPSASVGSIGIVAMHVDQSAYDAQKGLTYTYVHAGEEKVDGNPHNPLSDRARATIQADVDRLYGQFVDHVAAMRGVGAGAITATRAKVMSAQEAQGAGLVDAVLTRDEALAKIAADLNDMDEDDMDPKHTHTNGAAPKGKTKQAVLEHAAEIAALKADRDAAKAEIAALKAEAQARQDKAREDFVLDLAARAGAAQRPIAEADLNRVRALFKAGMDDDAKWVGEKLLERRALPAGGQVHQLAPGGDVDAKKRRAKHEAEQLRLAGWDVTMSADESEITKKVPPHRITSAGR